MNHLEKYKVLKSKTEKINYCLNLDVEKKYIYYLNYDKISDFTVNVIFKLLTGFEANELKERRHINYKEQKKY